MDVRPLALLAITILALAPAGAADPPALHGDWIEVATPRFAVLSTAGEPASRKLAAGLENLHGVLAARMGGEPEPLAPSRIFLLASRRAFERLTAPDGLGEAPISGYFRNTPDATYTVVDAAQSSDGVATLYHEYVHSLAAVLAPGLPLWFEEGLAELYQTFQVVDGAAEIGRPIPEHLARLRSAPLLPLADVLEVRHDSVLYADPDRKPQLYAQCWALVHYLVLGDPERSEGLQRFLVRTRRGDSASLAFREEIGEDLGILEKELSAYVRGTTFRFARMPVSGAADGSSFAVRPLTAAEAHAAIGDLLLSEDPPRARAEAHLRAAAAAESPPALALSGLAVLAERSARWSEALELHRRAVAADGDALVLLRAAELELHRGEGPRTAAALARRALSLQPTYARALETLAEALLAAGEAGPEAHEAARRAVHLRPRDRGALHTLVDVQIQLGLFGDAQSVVARSPALDAEARARVVSRIAGARAQHVRRLLVDGRLDEVEPELDAIRRLAPRATDPAKVEGLVEELTASHRTETLALRLRAAEKSLAAGEPGAARTLAASVVAEASDSSPLAGAAQALVDRIDGVSPPAEPPTFVVPLVSEAELDQLNHLLATGRFEEAEAVLEDLRVRVGSREGWWIEPKLAEVRRVIRHNRFVDAYNQAVDLAAEDRVSEAVAVLETLLAQDAEHPEAADARALLATLRGPAS